MDEINAAPKAFENSINENILREGRQVWIAWTKKAVFGQQRQIVEVFSVGTDITDRRRAEEEIHKLNIELEQRIRERTKELEAKNAELQRMNKLFVGRELRMIELKERIKEMEERRTKDDG